MSKTFRAWKIDQPLLLPLAVQDFVADDHLARFVLALIVDELDLIEIVAAYSNEKGQPPFDPHMMTALLLYAYCRGVYSSRRIAQACRERVDFMIIWYGAGAVAGRCGWGCLLRERNGVGQVGKVGRCAGLVVGGGLLTKRGPREELRPRGDLVSAAVSARILKVCLLRENAVKGASSSL